MRKSNNFATSVNTASMESCVGMPTFYIFFILDFAIINYTDVAATSPVKLGFLKSKLIFAEFGHCHEEKINALSASFKKLNLLRRATRKGEGERFPLSFLKIDKKYPNFGK